MKYSTHNEAVSDPNTSMCPFEESVVLLQLRDCYHYQYFGKMTTSFSELGLFKEIQKAKATLEPVVEKTPVIKSQFLSSVKQNVYFKMETLQRTGSFKLRGAFNKVANLTDEEKKCGIICSSAGNHAQGVAFSGQYFGIPAKICMPETTPNAKVENTRRYGAEIVLSGQIYDDAAKKATELRDKYQLTYIHPFDDDLVIAGQGTVGLEILNQLPQVDCIVVPIGGGGLISGIAVAAKCLRPEITIIGVQAHSARAMVESVEQKKRIQLDAKTIADGIQVREPGKRTFELISKFVDKLVTVTETEIKAAIAHLLQRQHILCEGAGAVPTAAFLAGKIDSSYKNVCLLCSGGNIDLSVVTNIIQEQNQPKTDAASN